MRKVPEGGPLKDSVSVGDLMGAFLVKGARMDWKPAGQITKVRNVWTKPHQGAREIARRKARMERK